MSPSLLSWQKKKIFRARNHKELRAVQKELNFETERGQGQLQRKMRQNNKKEMWNGMKWRTGWSEPVLGVKGGLEFATEVNLFFSRFDTTPTSVCSDSVSGSPSIISAPILTSAVDSLLIPSVRTIKDVATSSSLSSTMTLNDNPSSSSPSSSPPPNTYMSLEGGASQPLSPSRTRQPLLDFRNSLHYNNSLYPTPSSSLTLTSSQVERDLSRLWTSKASGPDNISSRVLKACAGQLARVFQHFFNHSFRFMRVHNPWKTSCIVPVPKKGQSSALNDYIPVALASHVMETFESLLTVN